MDNIDTENIQENYEEIEKQKQQQFLREEILQQNYDAAIFLEYCQKMKQNGSNVEVWTLEQLQEIVRSFQEENIPVVHEENQQNQEKVVETCLNYQNQQLEQENYPNYQDQELSQQHETVPEHIQRKQEIKDELNENQELENKEEPTNTIPHQQQPTINQTLSWEQIYQKQFQSSEQLKTSLPNHQNEIPTNNNNNNNNFDFDFSQVIIPTTNIASTVNNFDFLSAKPKQDNGFKDDFKIFEDSHAINLNSQNSNPTINSNHNILDDDVFNIFNSTIKPANTPAVETNQNQIPLKNPSQIQIKATTENLIDIPIFQEPVAPPKQTHSTQITNNNPLIGIFNNINPAHTNNINPSNTIVNQNNGQSNASINLNNNENNTNNNNKSINPSNSVNINHQNAPNGGTNESQQPNVIPKITPVDKYSKTINCKQLRMNQLGTMKEVSIRIERFQLVAGSMFTSSYCLYSLQTDPINIIVKRQLSDFQFLRNYLIQVFPGNFVPPMPQNKTLQFDKETLHQKRMFMLEFFINEVVKSSQFLNNDFVEAFLTVTTEDKFKSSMKDAEKALQPKSLDCISTLTGTFNLKVTEDSINLSDSLKNYIDTTEISYTQLQKSIKQLMKDYTQVSKTLNEIGDIFQNMKSWTTFFNESLQQEENQVPKLQTTYYNFTNFFSEWSVSIQGQIKILNHQLYDFFKFNKMNISNLKETIQIQDTFTAEYVQRTTGSGGDNILSSLQNTLVSSKETIDTPSKDDQVLKEQYAYFNSVLENDTNRVLNDKWTSYSSHFISFSNLQKSLNSGMNRMLDHIITSLSQLQNG